MGLLCLLALLCGSGPLVARAQPGLTVFLNAPASSGVFDRVLGQVNDLPVTIQVAAEADVRIEISAVALTPLGWRVECHDHLRNEHQSREVISDDAHPLTQSAADEAAALVVRSLLQAILRADRERASAAVGIPDVGLPPFEPPPKDVPSEEAPSKEDPRLSSPWLGAGAQLVLVTSDADAATSLWGRAGWRWAGFALAVEGRYGLGVDLGDAVVSTTVATHALQITARMNLRTGSRAALMVSSSLGTHLFVRREARVATGWQATPSETLWSPSLGAGMEGRVALFGGLALNLFAGVDLLTRTPTLDRRANDGRARTVATLSWFVPRLALGLELSL